MSEIPKGQRFSQVYLRRPDLLPDSKRMRRRLGSLLAEFDDVIAVGNRMKSELGITLHSHWGYRDFWPELFADHLDLRDVLDSITIRHKSIVHMNETHQLTAKARATFIGRVQRIFLEEQVSYRVDDKGGVHLAVDAEFERSRVSTIGELGAARYANVRSLFEQAYQALDANPPDGKSAIRHCFFAAEGLFRLMFEANQLNAGAVQKHLKPAVDAIYQGQLPAIHVAQKQIAAFTDWIDGAHFYRHEPGAQEPALSQPPIEIAIEMVSQGAAFIRWLARIDLATKK